MSAIIRAAPTGKSLKRGRNGPQFDDWAAGRRYKRRYTAGMTLNDCRIAPR